MALETFALLVNPSLDDAKRKEGEQNIVKQLRAYGKNNAIIHWSFKHYCSFWRKLVSSTIDYGIELGKSFKEFYSENKAQAIFLETDVDESGELEEDEVDGLLKWLFDQVFGVSPTKEQESDRNIEKEHFRYRLDPDGDGKITFDEFHGFVASMIHWVDELQERRRAVENAEQQRAVACIQQQIRAFLLRKALAITIRNSIPAQMTEAIVWIGGIPLANAQVHTIKTQLELMGCPVRAVALNTKAQGPDGQNRCWALAAFNDEESADRVHFANTENQHTFVTFSQSVQSQASDKKAFDPASSDHHAMQLHVREIGPYGWDGTETGRGEFEDPHKLMALFEQFGQCLHVPARS